MYFITAMEDLKDGRYPIGARTFGFFDDLDNAKLIVENNISDINETIYDYVVIEKIRQGLYPDVLSRILYKFNYDKKQYEIVENDFPHHLWQATPIG
jgi:hypothetical protein